MSVTVTRHARKKQFRKKIRRTYRPHVLTPRGALSRPPGAHLHIEIFKEQPGLYPAVKITAEAHGKIRALIATCKVEISWLSPAKVTPKGDVIIYDVLVPHQECSGGSTAKLETEEIDGEDRLLCELMNERKHDMIRDLICWGHSHVNFATYPSGLDEETTHDYLRRMREIGKTHFVRLIANKGDDLFASLYVLNEEKAIHHAPIHAEAPDTKRWLTWAREQIDEKVIERIFKPENYVDFESFVAYDPQHVAEMITEFQLQFGLPQRKTTTTGGVPPCRISKK